ncbi:hypothetical protein QAD02_008708, partial [Eretmocerus hayati]
CVSITLRQGWTNTSSRIYRASSSPLNPTALASDLECYLFTDDIMPFFKVQTENNTKSVMVKGDTAEQVLTGAKKKLDVNCNCQLLMADGKTPVDDDVVEFAAESNGDPMQLVLIVERNDLNETMNVDEAEGRPSHATARALPQPAAAFREDLLESDVDFSRVMIRIPDHIINFCEKGTCLTAERRKAIAYAIRDYLIEDLDDTRRSTERLLCRMVCDKYPQSMAMLYAGTKWDDGFNLLVTAVHNAVQVKKSKLSGSSKKRLRIKDNDADELERRRKVFAQNREHDEYGCVAYAPDLSGEETPDSQDCKRKELAKLYTNPNPRNDERILLLMKETYPTQRKLLTVEERNLHEIFKDWPFLDDCRCLKQHSSILLGKNVDEVWMESMRTLFKEMRLYFKSHLYHTKRCSDFQQISDEADDAVEFEKSQEPLYAVVIPLLLLYFKENSSHLYKVIKPESQPNDVRNAALTDHPILVIGGTNIYSGVCYYVVIEQTHLIKCNNFLEGILMTFLSYYIFGYDYKREIEKTLELTQMLLLRIVPKTPGTKKDTSRSRQVLAVNSHVRTLVTNLSSFSSVFKLEFSSNEVSAK